MQSKTNETLTNLFAAVEDYHWWFIGRRKMVDWAIVKFAPKRKRLKILDVGCGTGGTLKHLQPLGEMFGVDVSQRCVNYCHKKGLRNVSKASATKLPAAAKSFDVVLLLDVLEHVKKESAAIAEAKRVLKDDGIIIVTLPALPLIWSAHDTKQGHVKRYIASDLPPLADDNLLHLLYKNYFNFFLAIPIAIMRISSRYIALSSFNDYESAVNLNIARHGITNILLTKFFTLEIALAHHMPYPFGISLVGIYKKAVK